MVYFNRSCATQVFADKFNNQFKPIRDPDHRNFLSTDDFPNKFLPRYATGNFYMLSVDLAHFIVNRGEDFRTIGSLEDVTFAIWLSKIAVRFGGIILSSHTADSVQLMCFYAYMCMSLSLGLSASYDWSGIAG